MRMRDTFIKNLITDYDIIFIDFVKSERNITDLTTKKVGNSDRFR